MQGEWIKVKVGRSKKVVSPKSIGVKNRFCDEESNIVRDREDGTNDTVLGDSQVRDLGIELLNIGKVSTRKRLVMYFPGADVDFIKDGLELTNSSKGVILHVGENSIRNRDGTFEGTERLLLKKYRELLVRAKEIGKKVCVIGILPRLGENEVWL